jgi:hypothetical protein
MKYFKLKFLLIFAALAMAIPPAWAGTETVVFSQQGYDNGEEVTSYVGTTFSLSFDKGENTATPKYYDTGTGVRLYRSNNMTVSSSKTITKIELSFGSGDGTNAITTDVGTYSNGTWNGSATTVLFTVGGTSGHRRLSAVTVTTKDSGDPSISFEPNPLPINDNGGTFTVSGSNLPTDGLGVKYENSQLTDFSFNLDNGDNTHHYFPVTGGSLESGIVSINYTGRALSATALMNFESGSANETETINYRSDVYIVTDNGVTNDWHFERGVKMDYANNTYTGEFTSTNPNTYIVFARKLTESSDIKLWNNRLAFGPSSGGDWVYGTYTSGDLDLYNTNVIKFPEAGTYTITIDATNKTFSIEKAPEPSEPVTYVKVTSADQFVVGKKYIFVHEGAKKAMGDITSGKGNPVDIVIKTDGKIDVADNSGVIEFTLGGTAYNYTFAIPGGGYLRYGSSTNIYGDGNPDNDANGYTKWKPRPIGSTSYSVTNVGNTDRSIKANSTSIKFGCYTHNDSNSDNIAIYVEDDGETPTQTVATPTIDPVGGSYKTPKSVTINCATEGAEIRYTTDGTDPTANSTLYDGPITVNTPNATTTIKAIGVKTDMNNSGIATAEYTLPQSVNTLAAANALAPETGNSGVDFFFTGDVVVTYAGGDYIWLRDVGAITGGGLFYRTGTEVTTPGAVLSQNWGASAKQYKGLIEFTNAEGVANSGNTAPYAPFDRTGVALTDAHMNEYIVFNNVRIDSKDDDNKTYTATYVGENREAITYQLYDQFGKSPEVGKTYNITGLVTKYNDIQVYPTYLEEVPQVATPTFSPNGGEFTAAQEVTISCATENAKIYYSLDRENWTEGTTLTVDRSGKVYAKATKANMQDSEVAEATFTINYPAITVTLEPETETYTVGDEAKVKVTVANTVGTATVTYMTGETAETANTPVTPDEDGYITIPTTEAGTVVLKVTASDAYHAEPVTAIGTYTINHKALTITLTPENAEFNVGAQDTKVKVDIDNVVGELVEDYKATYTYNGEEKTLTLTRENGYITLPNDKAVTYNVTATVMDERMDDVTATGTYTFTALPAITFDLSTDQVNYTVGDVVKVKATDITGTFGEYDVTYMIGETQLIPDNDGYVTFTSDEVGDVTLTVTVEDLYEHESAATQEITFHFAAGGPISITLTADPEAETYTVGDVVNVKVTTNGTIGNDNDVLITYTTDFESKAESTYDPKKGIDITSDKAGDVTLTVNVYDGYAHEGADENGITTKTADYTFVKAPAINITFDPASGTEFTVGQEAKVKVTIAGAADDYEAEYKIGDNVVEPVDGYIVLPNTATDDVTLTVSVYDGIDRIGADESGFTTATATYTFSPMPVVAAPTFSLVAGTYGKAQQLTITAENGANILYSTDGSEPTTPYNGAIDLGQGTTTVKAVATKDGFAKSPVVTATYIIDIPKELPTITPFKGYYQIKNNGNNKYANIAGRKTLNFTDAENAKKMAGTLIWLETNDKGQVQSIRSQAADLQGYANRAMRYVPQMVDIVVNKINEMEGIEDATGAGSVLGENGLEEIMAKFNECFDYHLYVEQAQGGWRLYGKTPNMQHVVDFYRDHKDQVEAKLPKLEQFINDALHKLINKIGGSTVFTDFSLRQIWENMGGNLPEPVVGDDAAIMDFYRAVLNNKNYVWDFAYQTAQIYWGNVKSHPRYEELKAQLGEYADYIDEFVTQVRPDFKYYVIQRGDEPDYISEGNGEIINNDPRTLWTLEPRTDFTVNIAGEQFGCPYAGGVGGYATTNYTDFAYTVPEGVTAYKVASVENGVANLQALSGVIPAQTPVLLMAKEAKDYVLTLSTEAGTAVEGNLLVGPDYLIKTYELKTPMVESLFSLAKGVLGEQLYNQYVAQYEYLQLLYAGTVNNKYFWGLTRDDVMKCLNANGDDCVVRDLSGSKFIDNRQVKTNKAFLVSETDQTITISTLRGDVNHDGYVNIDDVTALIDYLLEVDGRACPYCANVNCDSTVNIVDVTYLIDILLGNISPYAEGGNGN